MPRQRVRKGWRKWVNTVNVSGVVIAVLTALPLYWLVSTSLKPASEIGQSPPTAVPQSFTLDNFVVAFRDNPRFPYDMFECVETYGPDHDRCNVPRAESLLPVNPLEALAARHEDLHSIDLTDRLCTGTTCPGVVGNIMVYRDLDHVTSSYGETLVPDVEERLLAALDRT